MTPKIKFRKKSGRKKTKKMEKQNSRQLRGRGFPIPTKTNILKNIIKYKQQIIKQMKNKKVEQGSWNKDHGSWIKDLGPWTWHE